MQLLFKKKNIVICIHFFAVSAIIRTRWKIQCIPYAEFSVLGSHILYTLACLTKGDRRPDKERVRVGPAQNQPEVWPPFGQVWLQRLLGLQCLGHHHLYTWQTYHFSWQEMQFLSGVGGQCVVRAGPASDAAGWTLREAATVACLEGAEGRTAG